jgi:hypothetical protein
METSFMKDSDMDIPLDDLAVVQDLFHQLIRQRAESFGVLDNLKDMKLPELSLDILAKQYDEYGTERQRWFAVPGMYGGFAYTLDYGNGQFKLRCDSWCRVWDGSGQSHEITIDGVVLIADRIDQ